MTKWNGKPDLYTVLRRRGLTVERYLKKLGKVSKKEIELFLEESKSSYEISEIMLSEAVGCVVQKTQVEEEEEVVVEEEPEEPEESTGETPSTATPITITQEEKSENPNPPNPPKVSKPPRKRTRKKKTD